MRPDSDRGVPEFDGRVLRWTIDDVTSPELSKQQVGVIPMEFSSAEEYLEMFRVPLLEEVRAQLHQALGKSIGTDGHAMTTTIRKIVRPNPKKVREEDKSTKRILEFNLPSTLEAKCSDLVLLCSAKPLWNPKRERLLESGAVFMLGCIVFARRDSRRVSAAVHVQDGSAVLMKMRTRVWHVVLPGVSLMAARRIWNAIHAPLKLPEEVAQKSVTHSVLRVDRQVSPIGTSDHEGEGSLRLVEEYSNSRGLNESQAEVVKSALAALLAEDAKPHVRMVQGPPGTGKTAMLVTLISVLGCLGRRTLISAPTNSAVIEVSSRMMRFFDVRKNDETFSSFSSRTREAGTLKRCFPMSVSDIVLLGSVERLRGAVDDAALGKIFLHDRILRIQDALNYRTGWKASVESVVTFLTTAPAIFKAAQAPEAQESDDGHSKSNAKGKKKSSRKEKEKEKEEQEEKDKEKKQMARNHGSFWSFARESMAELHAQMKKACIVLTSEVPRSYMDMATSNTMTSACDLMTSLVSLMPSEAPADATTWFDTSRSIAILTDILSRGFQNLTVSSGGSSTSGKMRFIQARDALLEALSSSPGCSLFPKGRAPSPGWLRAECLKSATLVFSTVSGAARITRVAFECAIIDEASQLVEAETAIVMRMQGLKQLILVGDHKQLPATVISKVAEKSGYGRSLFDRLQTLQHGCCHMLNVQYRMKPTISQFPNSQFYEGKVKDGPNVMSPAYGASLHNAAAFGAYAFLDCRRGAEVSKQKSWMNPTEVEVVTSLVAALGKVCATRNIQKVSVGVISPYVMQVAALKQSLDRQVLHRALQVEVNTVDAFQGNERDVIIFSAVRSNESKNIGFVDDCRRLNVAVTRGRHCVWIVGNAKTLSGGGKIWKKLVADARARECYHVMQG